MLNYHEILDRANTGPYLSEENWDLEKVAMTTAKLVKKYGLGWDPECIVTDEKLPVLQAWLRRRRIGPEATVYVGNDVPDVPCMAWAGCGVAPADAWPEARAAARIVLDTPGGRGCIRELAQLLWSRHGSGGTGPPPSPHDSGRAADAQDR